MDRKQIITLQAEHVIHVDKETQGRSVGTRDWPKRAARRILTYLELRPELEHPLERLSTTEKQELIDVIEELIQQTGIRNRGYANEKLRNLELRTDLQSNIRNEGSESH